MPYRFIYGSSAKSNKYYLENKSKAGRIKMFLNIITKLKVKTFLFISYLSVLLFPIFIFTYSYIENYQILKNEINNSNIILLEQIKDSIDSYISDFNKICLNLQVNKSVQLISYDEGALDLRDHYTLYELKQALASYK